LPKLDPFIGIIDGILKDDKNRPPDRVTSKLSRVPCAA
jgi:hypothetical protein